MDVTEVVVRRAKNGVIVSPMDSDVEFLVVGAFESYASLFCTDVGKAVLEMLYLGDSEEE